MRVSCQRLAPRSSYREDACRLMPESLWIILRIEQSAVPRHRGALRATLQNCQTACKPGSVRAPCGAAATIPLGRASLRASRDQPGRLGGNALASRAEALPPAAPIRSCSRWGLPCHPCCQGCGALLPHRFTLPRRAFRPGRAVCFLWHCPWGRPRRQLTGTVFPWSPDFPPIPRKGSAAARPSGSGATAPGSAPGQAPPTRSASANSRARVPASASPVMLSGRQWR